MADKLIGPPNLFPGQVYNDPNIIQKDPNLGMATPGLGMLAGKWQGSEGTSVNKNYDAAGNLIPTPAPVGGASAVNLITGAEAKNDLGTNQMSLEEKQKQIQDEQANALAQRQKELDQQALNEESRIRNEYAAREGTLKKQQGEESATSKALQFKLGREGTYYASAEEQKLNEAHNTQINDLTNQMNNLINQSKAAISADKFSVARQLQAEANDKFNQIRQLSADKREQEAADLAKLTAKSEMDAKTFELASKKADIFSLGALDTNATGNVALKDDASLIEYAQSIGQDPAMLKAAALKQAQALNKLNTEDRKNEMDIQLKQKELALKGLDIAEKSKVVSPDMNSYEKNILVSRIGKQIYGTKISDAEGKRVQSFIDAGSKMGKTEQEIMDDVVGFKITSEKNKPLAENLRTTLLQGAGDDGLAGFDMYGLARLINNGQTGEAINKAEKMILDKQNDEDTKDREASTSFIMSKGDSIIKQIQSLSNKFGLASGNWEKLKKKVAADPEFQKVSSDLTALIADWRNKMLGSAVTPSEQAWLDDLSAKTTDNPVNAIEKIKAFQNMNSEQLNSRRALYGMPAVDRKSLSDYKERAKLYDTNLKTLEDHYTDFYASHPNKADLEKQMNNPIMGATEEERMRNIMKFHRQSFNEPLSMGQNYSTEVPKIASAIGQFESGGNYRAIGKDTGSGDKAMGKYQVMASNVPGWTKEALGYSMTPQEFLSSPEAQDKVAHYKMGQYYKKYGTVEDVATAWFAGPGAVGKNSQAKDVVGTSVPQYIKNIRSLYNNLG